MNRSLQRLILVFALTLLSQLISHAAENWPQFRGPGSRGWAEDNRSLPEVWSATQNVVWSAEIPGMGWSSPIVWGKRVFVTTVIQEGEVEPPKPGLYLGGERDAPESVHHWKVYCLDFDSGKFLWEREAHSGVPQGSRHMKNSYASETPVTDGERVYAYFGNTGLFVYDMEGNPAWSKSWDPVKVKAGWGTAASPVLHGDRLILVNDNDTQSFITALDSKTGKEIWRKDRDEKSNWSTPFIWENEKRTEIVTAGTGLTRSYDLNGELLWSFKGMSKITIPTPFAAFGLLYIASGFILDSHRPVYAIRPGATGDITLPDGAASSEFIAWKDPTLAAYNPSPLVYGDHLYVLYDRGLVACSDARTGEPVHGAERLARGNAYTASPWAYNGKVFCLSEDGETHVIEAGKELNILHSNPLNEMCLATPAIASGSLILRTASRVYRIENSGHAGPRE
ncbi:MAG: PQQ-like beta-propeller repeat protein [Candidatus Omnitrophica bacterium]|nr:PQQ-like beta-propeller repeat protein [Candidatus Omnitrophota bacterium]